MVAEKAKMTPKKDTLAEKSQFPYERRLLPIKVRIYAEKVVVVARISKMTIKSDTLAVKTQLSYERRLLPIKTHLR